MGFSGMEEENDDNYQEEPEVADVFDRDFDEDETEPYEEAAAEDPVVREEDVKKRAMAHKAVCTGPRVRYISKDGASFLEFTKEHHLSLKFLWPQFPIRRRPCVRSPVCQPGIEIQRRFPYTTREAFKIIQQRCLTEAIQIQKVGKMGTLSESLCGSGFSGREKRSVVISKKTSV